MKIASDTVSKALGKDAVRAAVDRALVEVVRGAIRIEGEAKRLCPVNFGRLRASLTHGPLERAGSAVVVRVGTNVKYARFVEFGTGPRGAASVLSQVAREFMGRIGYKHGPRGGAPAVRDLEPWMNRRGIDSGAFHAIWLAIRRRGTRAQPFLFPAFERWRTVVAEQIRKALAGEFLKGVK